MPSLQGSPKKKLMDRIISGMSPGKRRTSAGQSSVLDQMVGAECYSDDSSSDLSRRSSLRSTVTTLNDYRSAYDKTPMMIARPTDPEELDQMFRRVLVESNLGKNERMLSLKDDDKWRLIQAHARAESQNDSPISIIEKMSLVSLQLEQRRGSGGLKILDKSVIDSLKVSFRTASVSWLQTFVENGGSELMVQIMRQIHPERNKDVKVSAMIEAIKTFSNCPYGIECFVQREGLLDTLLLYLDSKDLKIRQNVLHILTAIIYMDGSDGLGRIIKSFTYLQNQMGDAGRFDCLLRLLADECKNCHTFIPADEKEKGRKFASDILIFINLLLETTENFSMRIAIRSELLRYPFKQEFERLEEIGLGHQKEMFLSAAESDQEIFDEKLDHICSQGLSFDDTESLFRALQKNLLKHSREKDSELCRLLTYLMLVPGGQLQSDHLALLRQVLEAVLFSGHGLTPNLLDSPIPLLALNDFISCLKPLDQRNLSQEAVTNLRKSLREALEEKEKLEANLDSQINQIRNTYENEQVKLKIDFEDLKKQNDILSKKNSSLMEELQAEREELVRLRMERLGKINDDIPTNPLTEDEKPRGKEHIYVLNIPQTIQVPPAPPLPSYLVGTKVVKSEIPAAPQMPSFLKSISAKSDAPAAPQMPAFLKSIMAKNTDNAIDSFNAPPPAPPLPGYLSAKKDVFIPSALPMPEFLKGKVLNDSATADTVTPTPPPLPSFLQNLQKNVSSPAAPLLPAFLRGKGETLAAPPPPPLPEFLNRAEESSPAPLPPPLPAFMQGKIGSSPAVPPLPGFLMNKATSAKVEEPETMFPNMPKASRKLKLVAFENLSKYQASETFWPSIDAKTISNGIFDLQRFEQLLEATDSLRKNSSDESKQTVAPLLDSKDSKNLSIVLRGCQLSDTELVEGIKKMKDDLPQNIISNLCDTSRKIADESFEETIGAIKSNSGLKLDRPELVLIQIYKVEHWRGILEMMQNQANAKDAIQQMHDLAKPIKEACDLLKDAKDLFSTMGCMLYLGNYANQENPAKANAYGFRVGSIKTVTSMKTSDKDCSMMHYLVEAIAAKHGDWLEFCKGAEIIELAKKMTLSELESQISAAEGFKSNIVEFRPDDRESDFAKKHLETCKKLTALIADAKKEIESVHDLLKSTFSLFGEKYDRSQHEIFLGALADFFKEIEEARKLLQERQQEAELKAKRQANAKGRQRSVISKEHKFGCVDNIMDRLRSEITAAAGRPSIGKSEEVV